MKFLLTSTESEVPACRRLRRREPMQVVWRRARNSAGRRPSSSFRQSSLHSLCLDKMASAPPLGHADLIGCSPGGWRSIPSTGIRGEESFEVSNLELGSFAKVVGMLEDVVKGDSKMKKIFEAIHTLDHIKKPIEKTLEELSVQLGFLTLEK